MYMYVKERERERERKTKENFAKLKMGKGRIKFVFILPIRVPFLPFLLVLFYLKGGWIMCGPENTAEQPTNTCTVCPRISVIGLQVYHGYRPVSKTASYTSLNGRYTRQPVCEALENKTLAYLYELII